jgi:hypothetical protein
VTVREEPRKATTVPSEEEFALSFSHPDHTMEAGTASKLRLVVSAPTTQRSPNGYVLVRFETPSNLRMPAQAVEKGSLEIDITISADLKTGKFQVRVLPEKVRNTGLHPVCTVTVVEPQRTLPEKPRACVAPSPEIAVHFLVKNVTIEAGQSSKLRVAVERKGGTIRRGDFALQFEAPSEVQVAPLVLLEEGQVAIDVPIAVGSRTGKFEVKVQSEGPLKARSPSDACLVTVLEAPGRVSSQPRIETSAKDNPPRSAIYLRSRRQVTCQVEEVKTQEFARFCQRCSLRIVTSGRPYKDGPLMPLYVPVLLAAPDEWCEIRVLNEERDVVIQKLRELRIEVTSEKPASLG